MIYLDNQSTTPLAPEALEAMMPWFAGPGADNAKQGLFANHNSAHRPGRAAAACVEAAREQVGVLFPKGGQVIFTSGATEAINIGMTAFKDGPCAVSAIEHGSVPAAARTRGQAVHILPVDADGLVNPQVEIPDGVRLVSCMQVSNEIGTIQPISALAERAKAKGALFFCDAVASAGKLAPPEGADLIAVAAHKLYGPKGIGALWVRDGLDISPSIIGGLRANGLLPGTLSPALCAGFAAAAQLASARMAEDREHAALLHTRAREILHRWTLNGSAHHRWPGSVNVRLKGLDTGRLLSDLGGKIAFSLGSACASGTGKPSAVISALGLSDTEARTAIRLGIGRYNTMEEVEEACTLIEEAAQAQGV